MWPFHDPRDRDEAVSSPLLNTLATMDGLSREQIDRLHVVARGDMEPATVGRLLAVRWAVRAGRMNEGWS